ncbi:MAG: 1-deoxy-D-xylulose-5-phosphate synthase [Clostridia bacterium]|nr:1-deoxy-D-xylulose-5-phosphate synthase [Clostridia bacterium]
MENYELLKNIKCPADVRGMSEQELEILCSQIRAKLIETVSVTGGHLASNLGTVELTVALHKSFNSPEDSVIWDVGHQSYTHKLLTGRYSRFSTLRQKDGISGFTRPDESEHDLFYSGHAGVSVSQAAGVAAVNALKGNKNYAVAVIGDGSFTNGMVYEALDAAGSKFSRLIVVLNDNEMSISENVGSLARHLAVVRAKPEYYRFKAGTEKTLNRIPLVGKAVSNHIFKLKTALKNLIYSSSFFEDLGFRYIGPVDGHNITQLCEAMDAAKLVNQPVLLHVNTLKGKGYDFAENSPEKFHGVSRFDTRTGESTIAGDSFSEKFGELLSAFAAKDKRICAVTAAMGIGTGLERFAAEFPERFFDVGIAEEHALTFCSGLAAGGFIPVFAVYSTFFQRCYDQVVHDAALQGRKMIIAVDRAGFVGNDGETHQGIYDVSMLSGVPNVKIYSPCTYQELGNALYNAFYKDDCVVVIRYPRSGELRIPDGIEKKSVYDVYPHADASAAIVTYGRMFSFACEAVDRLVQQGIDIKAVKLNVIKPLDEECVQSVADCGRIYFYEEGVRSGGAGEGFALMLLEKGYKGRFCLRAVENRFVPHESVSQQLERCGLDCDAMVEFIKNDFDTVGDCCE